MKKPEPVTHSTANPLDAGELELVRGGLDVTYGTTRASGGDDDDDPNGSIIIISRDGP